MTATRTGTRTRPSKQTMIRLLASRPTLRRPPKPLVNLGCGRRVHSDWTNCDLVPASADVLSVDVRRDLPFDRETCDAIYASHVLEHLAIGEARRLVAELFRVLTSGGVVRIVVPDLEGIVRAYVASLDRAAREGSPERLAEHRWMTVELLDQLVRDSSGGLMRRWWSCDPVPCREFLIARLGEEAAAGMAAVTAARESAGRSPLESDAIFDTEPATPRAAAKFAASGERHRWMYDRVSLGSLLEAAGFRDVRQTDATTSRIPGFVEACLDTDSAGRARKPDSLYVEGVRP
jgi:predicted SAM-dependent methyltransferase